MVKHIALHEAAHVLCFTHYGVKATATVSADRGMTTPEPNTLTPNGLLICYVAGVCGEVLLATAKSPHTMVRSEMRRTSVHC